jgi:hypothetical protein
MYSVMEGLEHGLHYSSSPTSFLHPPPLTSTASILNLSSEFSLASVPSAIEQQQQHQYEPLQGHEYKTEPATPSCPGQETYSFLPTAFTPSPSSSGCESPNTPGPGYIFFPSSANLQEGGAERISISFPAPTPPLSASHQSKDGGVPLHHHNGHHGHGHHHALAETSLVEAGKSQCSFTDEQVDCICDNLQQRMDVEMLGKYSTVQVFLCASLISMFMFYMYLMPSV